MRSIMLQMLPTFKPHPYMKFSCLRLIILSKYVAIRVTVTFLVRAAQRRGGMRWVLGWDLAESRILESGIG
jgi:hypothetical protein